MEPKSLRNGSTSQRNWKMWNETKTEVMCLRMHICNKKRGGKAKVKTIISTKKSIS